MIQLDEPARFDYTGDRAYKKGRTFIKIFTFDEAVFGEMSGCTFAMKLKKNYDDASGVDFVCSFNTTTNELTFELPNSTADLLNTGEYIADIKVTESGKPYQVAEGVIEIRDTVT